MYKTLIFCMHNPNNIRYIEILNLPCPTPERWFQNGCIHHFRKSWTSLLEFGFIQGIMFPIFKMFPTFKEVFAYLMSWNAHWKISLSSEGLNTQFKKELCVFIDCQWALPSLFSYFVTSTLWSSNVTSLILLRKF